MKYRYLSIFLILLILSIGAVSAQDDVAADDSIAIVQDDEVLSASEFVIDDSNYDNYFDESGLILENSNISDGDTIKLGNVSDKDFVIDKQLTVTSNSSSDVLTNVSVYLFAGSDNSEISNLNIAGDGIEKTPINVRSAENVTIHDNVIDIVGLENSYDFYAICAYYADNLNVQANVITYDGKSDGTATTKAVAVSESSNVVIGENTIYAKLVSAPINWVETPPASYNYVPFAASGVISLNDCEGVELSYNLIEAVYSGFTGDFDTIYTVELAGCDDAVVQDNIISGFGHSYIYGLVIRGYDLTVSGNEIAITSDETYAAGIEIDDDSTGTVDSNQIWLLSPYVAYGIYAAMNWGTYQYPDVDYLNNEIQADSHAVYAMNLYGVDALIEGNKIVARGNYTMGILSMMMDDIAVITNNEITVEGLKNDTVNVGDMVDAQTVGIVAVSESEIKNNAVTSAGNYTIVSTDSGSEITDNYLYASELFGDYSVDDKSEEAVVENNIPIEDAENYNVTNDTFSLFFTENGVLRDGINSETLTFIGEFSEKTLLNGIGRSITLIGDNATLHDMSFIIASDGVVLDGFNFITDGLSEIITVMEADDVSVINCNFTVAGADDDDNYVICVIDSENVLIANNTIAYSIIATDEIFKNNVICARGSNHLIILSNEINALMPSRSIDWATGTVYSEAVCMDECDVVSLCGNAINVKSNGQTATYDTLYGVGITGSEVYVLENDISVFDAPYGYALVISGEDLNIEENQILVFGLQPYACGIDVESNSEAEITANYIVLSGESAYGIYTADWAGDVKAIIEDNVISIDGDSLFGMSLSGSETSVEGNIIYAEGNYATGIASTVDEIEIVDNFINVTASNSDTLLSSDSMGIETAGIHIVSGNANVAYNTVTSTGDYAVHADGKGSVINNNLIASELMGDDSVNATDMTLVENNIPIANATNYNLTNDTFYLFFDKDGYLYDDITSESLTFIGEFSNLSYKIYIDRPIALLSDNATINDMFIYIACGNVSVDGFTFVGSGSGIYIHEADNVNISNCEFDIDGYDDDGNCVIAIESSNNVLIDSNRINLDVETNGTYQNMAVVAMYSDGLNITNNIIYAYMPARSIDWGTGTVYSEAVGLNECNDALIADNIIGVYSNGYIGTYDTVYTLDIKGDNAVVRKNYIGVNNAPYGYAVIVSGEDFLIEDNDIFSTRNESYACAIEVDGVSSGVIFNNEILAIADSAYGIYTANWAGDVKVNITQNVIESTGNTVFGLSLSGSEALVVNNIIDAIGNYTTGIASAVDQIDILYNEINVNGSNVGIPLGYDSMGIETVGVHIVSGNANVAYNIVTSTGDYTVHAEGEGSVTNNNLIASELVGDDSVNATDMTLVENNIPIANATNYNLTNDTFYLFFDKFGYLYDEITSESLTFIGEFSNLLDEITIDRQVNLLSDNATLHNMAIYIESENVTVDGFTFADQYAGIGIFADNVTIANNEFYVNGFDDWDNDIIEISESDDVSILNNKIYLNVESNGTYKNYAIDAYYSNGLIISNNFIDAYMPSRSIDWTTGTVYSAGILLEGCDNAVLENNTAMVKSNDEIDIYDTIYAVDVSGDNVSVIDNRISVEGAPYGYALVITGKDFIIDGNVLSAGLDESYACGIDVESNSNGIIENNNITVEGDSVYGIYTANWAGDVKADISNNTILANGITAFAMSLSGSEATVENNNVWMEGNFTTGIASKFDMIFITNNTVFALGSDEGTPAGYDSMGIETVGVHIVSGDALVKDNYIAANSTYAVDMDGTGAVTDNRLLTPLLKGDFAVDYTQGSGVLVANNTPAIELNYTLTNDTFFVYFDKDGRIREQIEAENLTFIGNFSDLVDEIVIERPIVLLSDNATLNDMAMVIMSDDVTVDGFTFNSDCLLNQISIVEADNVTVSNNKFYMSGVEDTDNIAVFIMYSDDALFVNNTMYFKVESNETHKNAAIYAFESEDLAISFNEIYAYIPSRSIDWTTGDVYSRGVVVEDCDDVVLQENIIGVRSSDKNATYDTIYAVDILSDNAAVLDNLIVVSDAPYGYGLVVTGKDFVIDGNEIYAGENETYACGIDIESNSNGIINDNEIIAKGESAYGIYTANWAGDVKAEITNNDINATGVNVFGMSLSGSEATVDNNTIIANGNFTTGIASKFDMIFITNNTINANGTNEGTPTGYDSMGIETIGVHIVNGDALVKGNDITSNSEFAVSVEGTGAVTDNNLVAKEYTGDAAVDYDLNDTLVANNTPIMARAVISAQDIVMYYKNGTRYVVILTDQNGKPLANLNVTLTINGASYTRTTDENGTVSLAINLNSGNYTASATFIGVEPYTDASVENNITVLSTVYGDDIVKVFRNGTQYYATFLDGQGNPLPEGTEVTFNINGVMYKRYVNGNEGKAKLNINLEQGEYIITAINPENGEMHANNVTVLASIVNNEDLVKFYKNDSQYVVTILGDDGNPVGAGKTVKFNINGVFYERQTNELGQAKLNINLQPGDYVITAEYNGCRVSNEVTVLPILFAKDLVKKYGTSDQFRALLLDGHGNPYPGQTITFNIHGIFYQRVTDGDGYAALNIKLGAAVDTYIITSSYDGTSISNTIKVEP